MGWPDVVESVRKSARWFFIGPSLDELLEDAEKCALCGGSTNPTTRRWSTHHMAWIDAECIPPYVSRRGREALTDWLDTGEVPS